MKRGSDNALLRGGGGGRLRRRRLGCRGRGFCFRGQRIKESKRKQKTTHNTTVENTNPLTSKLTTPPSLRLSLESPASVTTYRILHSVVLMTWNTRYVMARRLCLAYRMISVMSRTKQTKLKIIRTNSDLRRGFCVSVDQGRFWKQGLVLLIGSGVWVGFFEDGFGGKGE